MRWVGLVAEPGPNRLQAPQVQVASLFSVQSLVLAQGALCGPSVGGACASVTIVWWKELEQNAGAERTQSEQKPLEKCLLSAPHPFELVPRLVLSFVSYSWVDQE